MKMGQAPGYFDYWDNVPNYYSYNAAGWHFINLNSVTELGQAPPGSAQYQWLVQDLNANTAACTIAYFHHPVYNVGPEGDTPRMNGIWSLLAQHGVDSGSHRARSQLPALDAIGRTWGQ